jgi:hypothetical protein
MNDRGLKYRFGKSAIVLAIKLVRGVHTSIHTEAAPLRRYFMTKERQS